MRPRAALLGTGLAGVLLAAGLAGCSGLRHERPPEDLPATARPPRLSPDYAGVSWPANLAPPSFCVREPGTAYALTLKPANTPGLTLTSRSGEFAIPRAAWLPVTRGNRNKPLALEVAVKGPEGRWQRFAPFTLTVVAEKVDPVLAYRRIKPIYNYWYDVGIYQRDLGSYRERTILHGSGFSRGCTNCHAFSGGKTERMSVGIRSGVVWVGTVLVDKGQARKLDVAWGYTAWHPTGSVAAYSMNKVRQFFHTAGQEVRDVVDLDSDLVVFDAATHQVTAPPGLAEPDRLETYPTWSPDGRTLYFCSAPILWEDRDNVPPRNWEKVRYELRRVSHDPASGAWGKVETVLSAEEAGGSVLLPRVNATGRWLVYCRCDYGCFPVFQPSSDLWLLDLQTGRRRALTELNSQWSESWHSWSSSGRWLAFSSKRADGLFTHTYLSFLDGQGHFTRPLLLPQRDPQAYDGSLRTYSLPEFIAEPVRVRPGALARAARSQSPLHVELPKISMTAKKKEAGSPWQQAPSR